MPTAEYYERLKEAAHQEIGHAADIRDRPTIDQYSSGVDGDARVASGLDRLREIEDAEEQGMTLREFRRWSAEQDAAARRKEEHMRSPAYAADIERARKARADQAAAERSIDARVVAVACTHFGEQTPLAIDYYGDGEQQVAHVQQQISGAPKRCRVRVATMTIE